MEAGANKICFIICCNNKDYLSEAVLYLKQLIIPEGFTASINCIENASSMTAGYQEGMEASNAKYKVYMHQDVFITNPLFLEETINLFMADPGTGLLGMAGTTCLPASAIMWENKKRTGALRSCTLDTVDDYFDIPCKNKGLNYVMAVDGLLMMTQYDIPWRSDIFDGWDFYDVSQSFEFRRAGYKIAVPFQEKPWVLHDCGFLDMSGYNKARKIFLNEYKGEW